MHTVSITSRLETVAEFGAYEISLFVWDNTRRRLSKQDIKFTDLGLKSCRKGEGYYLISWADAEVPNLPADWDINEIMQSRHLSQGQALWLMAKDSERRKSNRS